MSRDIKKVLIMSVVTATVSEEKQGMSTAKLKIAHRQTCSSLPQTHSDKLLF